MQQPLVSIIIPVYNGSDYMKEAIDSALNQTYPNIEVLVINDGSKDNGQTDQIARSYGDKIRYIDKSNGGVATALNMGIKEMKGEYFSWLSHDDVYYPEKVQKQIDFLEQVPNKKIILYGGVEIIGTKSEHITFQHFYQFEKESFPFVLLTDFIFNGCTMLIPKECFLEHLFDTKLLTVQDNDLWFRLSKKYDFVYYKDILVKSRIHPNQGSKISPVRMQEAKAFYEKIFPQYPTEQWLKISKTKNLAVFYNKMAYYALQQGHILAANYCLSESQKNSTTISDFAHRNFLKIVSITIQNPFLKNMLKKIVRKP